MLYFQFVIKRKLSYSWAIFPFFISYKVFKIWCVLYLQHILVQTGCGQFLNMWLVATVVDSIALSLLVSSKGISARLTHLTGENVKAQMG